MTTGLVEVRLDADGAAEKIRIRAGLASRPADDIRDLIIAADVAAAIEVNPPDHTSVVTSAPEDPIVPETLPDAGTGSARDLSDLVGRAMAAFDRVGPVIESLTRPATSTTDDPVRMTLSCGRIIDVTIDSRWLSRTEAPELAAQLDRALATARAAYEQSQQSVAELNHDLAGLLADVKATLQMFAESGRR